MKSVKKEIIVRGGVPREHYHGSAKVKVAVAVPCFDGRWTKPIKGGKGRTFPSAIQQFMDACGFDWYDLLPAPGGARILALEKLTKKEREDRHSLVRNIKKGIALHNAQYVFLVVHLDCGANGYSKAFRNDEKKEMSFLCSLLRKAARSLRKELPKGVKVLGYLALFDRFRRIV